MAAPRPTVSIVIPAYNQEKRIAATVASALGLRGAALDVVVVNDGSTDQTGAILDELAARHRELRIISQANRGVSAARNAGLRAVRGSHTLLLDGGDEVLPLDLTPLLTDADLHAFGVSETSINDETVLHEELPFRGTGLSYLKERQTSGTLMAVCWKYIYSTSFLRASGLAFTEGIVHEDMLFCVQSLVTAQRVEASNIMLYRYIREPGSITTSSSRKHTYYRLRSLDAVIRNLRPLHASHPNVGIDIFIVRCLRYSNVLAKRCGSKRLLPGTIRRRGEIACLRLAHTLRSGQPGLAIPPPPPVNQN